MTDGSKVPDGSAGPDGSVRSGGSPGPDGSRGATVPDGSPVPARARVANGSRVSDYAYDLPADLIAQYPAKHRDESRLLVMPPSGPFLHGSFADVVDLFAEGDVIVVNESRVFPARLLGRKPTGAAAEVLLVRPIPGDGRLWEALVRPGGKLKPGRTVVIADDFVVEIVDALPSGNRVVRLVTALDTDAALDRYGHIPLPPYIDRADEQLDRERYQTVYARTRGSVAAPTAGLHFTQALLERLHAKGVRQAEVTLHVGVGTFRPVDADDPSEHDMHVESWVVSDEAAATIEEARGAGGRVWAVGTTAVRTLESAAGSDGRLQSGAGETGLFIRPPYRFRVVDALITNFHLPRSTLLMLVAALGDYERTMNAYAEAVERRYRFYSYGDAMVIPPK